MGSSVNGQEDKTAVNEFITIFFFTSDKSTHKAHGSHWMCEWKK